MPASRFEQQHAVDFERAFSEMLEEVIRRIGGQPDRTEPVQAIVDFDDEAGGLFDDSRGQRIEYTGKIEIVASQASSMHDDWVIRGKVFHQMGEATGHDGGSQTINIGRKEGRRGRDPRVTGR